MRCLKYNGDISQITFMKGGDAFSQLYSYDPVSASWLAPDPLAHDYPGLGPWSYCAANPVNLVDPDGRHTKVIDNGNGTYKVIGGD